MVSGRIGLSASGRHPHSGIPAIWAVDAAGCTPCCVGLVLQGETLLVRPATESTVGRKDFWFFAWGLGALQR